MTKNGAKTYSKIFLLSTVIAFAITVTFIHEYFPHQSKEYLTHKKNYKPIIKNRDIAINNLLAQLEEQTITKEVFIANFRNVKEESIQEIKDYNKIKREILAKDSYLGYNSIKTFWFRIGLPICGLVLALLFLNVIINPVQQKHLKKFYSIVSFAFIACWGYWLAWSLISVPGNPNRPYDFPRIYYNIALYILPIVLFIGAFYLMKYYASIEEKLRKILRPFFDFFYHDAEEKGLIRPEKMEEFDEITIKLTDYVVTHE